jgi:hypothetical protein
MLYFLTLPYLNILNGPGPSFSMDISIQFLKEFMKTFYWLNSEQWRPWLSSYAAQLILVCSGLIGRNSGFQLLKFMGMSVSWSK